MELGRSIARTLPPSAVILLSGNLGAGKTVLAKGIVSELTGANPDEVSSPTFTLIHEYDPRAGHGFRGRVYHIDLYRLDQPQQIVSLGLDELFDQQAVVLIEWGERFLEWMPENRIEIRLTNSTCGAGDERRIEVSGLETSQWAASDGLNP